MKTSVAFYSPVVGHCKIQKAVNCKIQSRLESNEQMIVTKTSLAESLKSLDRSGNRLILQTAADLELAVLYSVIGGVARAQIGGFGVCFPRSYILSCTFDCKEVDTGTSFGCLVMVVNIPDQQAFVQIAVDHALMALLVIESDRALVDKMEQEQALVALLWMLQVVEAQKNNTFELSLKNYCGMSAKKIFW